MPKSYIDVAKYHNRAEKVLVKGKRKKEGKEYMADPEARHASKKRRYLPMR